MFYLDTYFYRELVFFLPYTSIHLWYKACKGFNICSVFTWSISTLLWHKINVSVQNVYSLGTDHRHRCASEIRQRLVTFTVWLARKFSAYSRSFPPWLQNLFEEWDLGKGTNAMVQEQRINLSLEHSSGSMMSGSNQLVKSVTPLQNDVKEFLSNDYWWHHGTQNTHGTSARSVGSIFSFPCETGKGGITVPMKEIILRCCHFYAMSTTSH